MNELETLIYAGTTLIAVVIGHLISHHTTKKQVQADTISKSRHQWLSELRQQLSEINAQLNHWDIEVVRARYTGDYKNQIETVKNTITKIENSKLYLNPSQESHSALMKALNEARDVVATDTTTYADVYAQPTIQRITEAGQNVLKEAWEQIKSENI